ncbi:MAG: class I SAM-dependent methyltransferase [Culturomica sp.]|jgi:hypothetical protein|nr:class I SAM-dependent methyltransferase [Culturomica sp.]
MIHPLSDELREFIRQHADDDTDKLLLQAGRFPGIDIPAAVIQITARRQIRDKLPEWYANPALFFPSRLSAEQCSSEACAAYKQSLLKGENLCDLTGGLGIDSWYFSRKTTSVTYIEQNPDYCRAASLNFRILGAENIRIIEGDATTLAGELSAGTFYIDPARRAAGNRRLFALSDCEPDILTLKPLLLPRCKRLILKTSPMADIGETLRLLPETREIHAIALHNECKELLFVLEAGTFPAEKVKITCVNLKPGEKTIPFTFTPREEKTCAEHPANSISAYLYEPHAALLKGGAFKTIAERFKVYKLHKNSHLYTSGQWLPAFPGRQFRVEKIITFSGKNWKELKKEIPKANITVRNFPLTVAELRQRSGIAEGGDLYLFATTANPAQRIIIIARKSPEIAP